MTTEKHWLGTVGPLYGKIRSNAAPTELDEMVRLEDIEDILYPSKCRVYLTGDQVISTGSVPSIITFNGISYDLGEEYSVSSSKFTCVRSGIYVVNSKLSVNLTGATIGGVILHIYKNGYAISSTARAVISGMTYEGFSISDSVSLVETDTLDIRLAQTTGSSTNVAGGSAYGYFSVTRIA